MFGTPCLGPLDQPYRFRYLKDHDHHLHGAASGLPYTQILDRPILDWPRGFLPLWASLAVRAGRSVERAGVLANW